MGLSCARSLCREDAAASLQFDADGSRVLIVDLTDSVRGIPVCRTHVGTRTAPVGWTLVDERTLVQSTLLDADAAVSPPSPTVNSRSASYAPGADGPDVRPPLRRPVAHPSFSWPRDAREVALDRAPTGRLLRRAFGAADAEGQLPSTGAS